MGAVAKRLAAFGALLERVLPRKKVPPIQSREEADAARAFLVARVTGKLGTFAADEPARWTLVERVLERGPAIARYQQTGVDTEDGAFERVASDRSRA